MGQAYSQVFPPAAKFTEETLPDQAGKVFLVTGASGGIGKELCRFLYAKNAKVYAAARSPEKVSRTITEIKSVHPKSSGELIYLHLDLSDLSGIGQSTKEFLSKEQHLNVLWNNAGVMIPPKDSKTEQGYELQLGTNALGPFLFTKLLTPILSSTAKTAPPGTVRVVWLSSSVAEAFAPKGGVDMKNLDYKAEKSAFHKYAVSKAANTLYSQEFSKRYGDHGIISVSLDPGNLKTDLQRHVSGWVRRIWGAILHSPIRGAHTELFAGLSPDITPERNNAWIIPWGRFGTLRKDIDDSGRPEEEGGSGLAATFWNWSEKEVGQYAV